MLLLLLLLRRRRLRLLQRRLYAKVRCLLHMVMMLGVGLRALLQRMRPRTRRSDNHRRAPWTGLRVRHVQREWVRATHTGACAPLPLLLLLLLCVW